MGSENAAGQNVRITRSPGIARVEALKETNGEAGGGQCLLFFKWRLWSCSNYKREGLLCAHGKGWLRSSGGRYHGRWGRSQSRTGKSAPASHRWKYLDWDLRHELRRVGWVVKQLSNREVKKLEPQSMNAKVTKNDGRNSGGQKYSDPGIKILDDWYLKKSESEDSI